MSSSLERLCGMNDERTRPVRPSQLFQVPIVVALGSLSDSFDDLDATLTADISIIPSLHNSTWFLRIFTRSWTSLYAADGSDGPFLNLSAMNSEVRS